MIPAGSHLFRHKDQMDLGLMEGLAQAEVDYVLPRVIIQQNLKTFLDHDCDELFPPSTRRLFAHPVLPPLENPASSSYSPEIPSTRIFSEKAFSRRYERAVIVVGPEGGWEQREIQMFVDHGFELVNVGNRILRTDMAVSHNMIILTRTDYTRCHCSSAWPRNGSKPRAHRKVFESVLPEVAESSIEGAYGSHVIVIEENS